MKNKIICILLASAILLYSNPFDEVFWRVQGIENNTQRIILQTEINSSFNFIDRLSWGLYQKCKYNGPEINFNVSFEDNSSLSTMMKKGFYNEFFYFDGRRNKTAILASIDFENKQRMNAEKVCAIACYETEDCLPAFPEQYKRICFEECSFGQNPPPLGDSCTLEVNEIDRSRYPIQVNCFKNNTIAFCPEMSFSLSDNRYVFPNKIGKYEFEDDGLVVRVAIPPEKNAEFRAKAKNFMCAKVLTPKSRLFANNSN